MIKRFVGLFVISVFCLSCTEHDNLMFKKSSTVMDTMVTITVVSGSEKEAGDAIDAAFSEIRRLEVLLSFWTEDSEIAQINRNAGKIPVKVSPETLEIIERALYISRETDGAFDATIGPVIRQWNFWEKTVPDEESLRKALSLVDYREMEISKDWSTAYLKNERMSFDTGGIAKGFAADKAVDVLKAKGIKAGLVSVAGDIKAFGRKPDGAGWRIGIRDPRSDDPNDLVATFELTDEAVSTSGDYERFFIKDGIRYHHLLDPKTGYPAKGSISVTVITDDAVYTDGFSTGAFVLGPEKGFETLKRLGLEGVIITDDGKRLVTDGIRDRVRWSQ